MRRRHSKLIATLALGVTAAAVVKELRTPSDRRTWHGKLAGAVPYDFRMPTPSRIRSRWWNPDGPVFSPRAFGVGWDPNLGRIASEVRRATANL
jgi:hypothetical protein